MILAIAGFVVCFLTTWAGLGIFRFFALRHAILLDVPNERSNHSEIRVRGAGVVFVTTTIISWAILTFYSDARYLVPLLVGSTLVAGVSFLDDLFHLRIRTRLVAQVTGALVFLSAIPIPSVLQDALGPWVALWLPFAAFFMVSVINIYNFMDGIDGLAALHVLCVLASWILFSTAGLGLNTEVLLCMGLGAPLMAFLLHNWSPARVFMGDVGSTFLGFAVGALAVIQAPGALRSANFITLIALMFPFLFDASVTLLLRMMRGEKWYLPHSSHLFQRLVRNGYSHSAVASLYGGITLYSGWLASVGLGLGWYAVPIVVPLLILPYLGLYYLLYKAKLSVRDGLMIEPESFKAA